MPAVEAEVIQKRPGAEQTADQTPVSAVERVVPVPQLPEVCAETNMPCDEQVAYVPQ